MRVEFVLNQDQLQFANKVVTEVQATTESLLEEDRVNWRGNLLGYWGEDQSFNQDQSLVLDGGRLIWVGARTAGLANGGFHQMVEILLCKELTREETKSALVSLPKPVVYESSDRRLHWFEDMSAYLARNGSVAECLSYMGMHSQGGADARLHHLYPEVMKVSLREPDPAREAAGLSSEERVLLAKVRAIRAKRGW